MSLIDLTFELSDLGVSHHHLEVTWPIDSWNGLQSRYLPGDFGGVVNGSQARVVAEPSSLSYGDIVPQGLPFYTGNLILRTIIDGDMRPLRLSVPRFSAPPAGGQH